MLHLRSMLAYTYMTRTYIVVRLHCMRSQHGAVFSSVSARIRLSIGREHSRIDSLQSTVVILIYCSSDCSSTFTSTFSAYHFACLLFTNAPFEDLSAPPTRISLDNSCIFCVTTLSIIVNSEHNGRHSGNLTSVSLVLVSLHTVLILYIHRTNAILDLR